MCPDIVLSWNRSCAKLPRLYSQKAISVGPQRRRRIQIYPLQSMHCNRPDAERRRCSVNTMSIDCVRLALRAMRYQGETIRACSFRLSGSHGRFFGLLIMLSGANSLAWSRVREDMQPYPTSPLFATRKSMVQSSGYVFSCSKESLLTKRARSDEASMPLVLRHTHPGSNRLPVSADRFTSCRKLGGRLSPYVRAF